MKLKTEAKIGIVGIITTALIIWGINYLKGRNIFSSNNRFVAFYDQIDGLEPSADVLLRGFKVGTIENIIFDTENQPYFTVFLSVDKKYTIKKGSFAEIYSADLLGSKAIRIEQSNQQEYASSGDTLLSRIESDMISALMNDIQPVTAKVNDIVARLDSVGSAINTILSGPELASSLKNISSFTYALQEQISESGALGQTLQNFKIISDSLRSESSSINHILANLESLSEDIKNAQVDSMLMNIEEVTSEISEITKELKTGNGTIGKLIYQDSLYEQLNVFISDLDSLIIDINKNPKKYVQFSIF